MGEVGSAQAKQDLESSREHIVTRGVMEHRHWPTSIERLSLPERAATTGRSEREAERALERTAATDVLDLTYADFKRFPPPSCAIETVGRINRSEILQVTAPQGTAYMFPRLVDSGRSDQEVTLRLGREAQALINPGYRFGERGSGHFRICSTQNERVWDGALDRMIRALS